MLKDNLLSSAGTLPGGTSLRQIDVQVAPQQAQPGVRPVSVMLCIPSGREWEARCATAVTGLAAFSAMKGISIGICGLEGSMITRSRNEIVDQCLKVNTDYLMWIDSDIVMPPDTVIRLLQHNKDIVGATYNKRVPPYETLGKLKGPAETVEQIRTGGLREAELMPGGCMLVKADVYRRLGWPYYWEAYEWKGETGADKLKEFLRHNYEVIPPQSVLDSVDGSPLGKWLDAYWSEYPGGFTYWSEDLNFCKKARKMGARLWCDLDLTFSLVHLGVNEVRAAPPPLIEDDPIVAANM